MKKALMLSIQTGGWYEKMGGDANADASFRFIRECGFEALDFNIDSKLPSTSIRAGQLTDFFDADIETLLDHYRPVKAAADKHGLAFGQAHAPFPMNLDGRPDIHEYLLVVIEKICAVCQMMECPALIVHPIVVASKKQEWQENMKMYRRLIPVARKYGVKICLENMFAVQNGHKVGRACSDVEDACRYIDTLNEEAGEELFGFCYDVGHATLTAHDLLEDLRILGHRLTVLHIQDNDARSDLHMIPYTPRTTKQEFCTDWEGFVQGLREIGYRGTLNLETFGSLKGLPDELVKPMLHFASATAAYFRKRILE